MQERKEGRDAPITQPQDVGPGPTLATHLAPGGGRDGTREAERVRTLLREQCSRREHDNRIVSENDLQNMSDRRQTEERKQENKRTEPLLKMGLNTPHNNL